MDERELTKAGQGPTAASSMAIWLPLVFLIHLGEEWFTGFTEWTTIALGAEISVERFITINASAFLIFVAGTFAAFRHPAMAWFISSLAALLVLNGVLHTLATVGFGFYSPGTITGLLLYVPLGLVVLRHEHSKLKPHIFRRAVVFGVVLHGIVAFLAFGLG
jgi:hypothetical protein